VNALACDQVRTPPLADTIVGLIKHAEASPATRRSRERRRVRIEAAGGPVVTVRRIQPKRG
jgi:hypothetical protein